MGKQYSANLSDPNNSQTISNMPVELDNSNIRQDSYEELQFQNTAKTIVIDKLDLSSTTTSCDEGISNVNRDDSPNHKNIPQSKTKNVRKRKNEQNGDKKHSESKKSKKQKGSHLRRNIKNILEADALQAEAKAAKAEEQERLKRLHDAQ